MTINWLISKIHRELLEVYKRQTKQLSGKKDKRDEKQFSEKTNVNSQ